METARIMAGVYYVVAAIWLGTSFSNAAEQRYRSRSETVFQQVVERIDAAACSDSTQRAFLAILLCHVCVCVVSRRSATNGPAERPRPPVATTPPLPPRFPTPQPPVSRP